MFVVRETKQKRMIEMMDEKTLAYIRWYFRTSSIEEDMVYIDDKKEDGQSFDEVVEEFDNFCKRRNIYAKLVR